MVAVKPTIKPGTISYKKLLSDWPLIESGAYTQNKTVAAPKNIPAKAPWRVIFDQNKLRITTGPKEAPKPAQALLTNDSIELSRSCANTTASNATNTTDNLPTIRRSDSVAFLRRKV